MSPVVMWLLSFQFLLGPTLILNNNLQTAIKNFKHLFIDFPRLEYASSFKGYCNGIMSYVRGRMQRWDCPNVHYLVHVSYKSIQKYCKHSDNFCENYNQYCTITNDSFPLTICQLMTNYSPISCYYSTNLTNQKLYLLCSRRYNAEPIDIIGLV
ncbi:PREDICTED: probable inactive ribonuclease-like protein 13 [Elephantulus edwardii]|uniref:probable inactive ribonuclease-like protein 13 n=1 Tax=Elephantulus edwardii TaxID=28737 RepID=UPI0003F07BB1|nr:PREDICTED: probable inactive ribonuclease-like protein 13 [Elephantulus edwardii]